MRYLSTFKKTSGESWGEYGSRIRYSVLRKIHPKYKRQFYRESLVGPFNCWDQLQAYQLNILTRHGLKPHHTLLDIGCGPLTVGLKLIPYLQAGQYTGLDARTEPLLEAHRLVAENRLADRNPHLLLSTTFGKEELGGASYDFIWMSQLSYHLSDSQVADLFSQMRTRMKPGSIFLFDIMDPNRKLAANSKWSGYSFHLRPLEFFQESARQNGLNLQPRGTIEEYGYPRNIALKTNLLLELKAS